MSEKKGNQGNFWALSPLIVFLLLFLGTAAITKDFYKMPVTVAFVISGTIAILMNRNETIEKKVDKFCIGAGDPNIILMCIIFILAGAFAQVAKDMGAVQSTVNFGLSILPPNLLMAGVFIIACFISLSIGTSMGTIIALGPIGIGLAQSTGIPVALALGAVVGGAMFGDNLSMISDTTIAATRSQGCQMKDKFRTNFFIILPAAIITAILLAVVTRGSNAQVAGDHPYNIIKIVPYLFVLVTALIGMNVMAVLILGTLFAGVVGIATGSMDFWKLLASAQSGVQGMEDLAMIAILIGGIVEIIKSNGGIDYLLNKISKNIKSKRGAEFGIAALVSVADICTANNTIAIVMSGPIAKEMAEKFGVDPRKSASLLDTCSCVWQGIVPYGGQLLVAAGLAKIAPFEIMPYLFYPYLMAICVITAIMLGLPRFKTPAKRVEVGSEN